MAMNHCDVQCHSTPAHVIVLKRIAQDNDITSQVQLTLKKVQKAPSLFDATCVFTWETKIYETHEASQKYVEQFSTWL